MNIAFDVTDALLIIDPQNDFCDGGALEVSGGTSVMADINLLALSMSAAGATIVLSQDWHPANHKSFASTWYMNPFETIDMPYGQQTLWPNHCVQGSLGAEFHERISDAVDLANVVVRKGMNPEIDSYSAFVENDQKTKTGLAGYLADRGIKRVFLAGLAYDYCVGFSALDAAAAGFEVVVVRDLTRAIADTSALAMDDRLHAVGASEIKFNETANA